MHDFWLHLEAFLSRVNNWEDCASVTIVCMSLVFCFWITMRYIAVVLRGWPKFNQGVTYCNHPDNLSGRCLKPAGCRTNQECEAEIELHTKR